MNDTTLITYASRAGSTAGVADAIGKTLAENGVLVEVRRMNEVTHLSAYRAVVAGSAIQRGQWLEPVRAQARPVSEGLFAGALDIGKDILTRRAGRAVRTEGVGVLLIDLDLRQKGPSGKRCPRCFSTPSFTCRRCAPLRAWSRACVSPRA